jgi:hypothetical protein
MSTAVIIPFAPKTTATTAAIERYGHAYDVSEKTSAFAETVRLGGIAVAGVLWVCALIAYQAIPRERSGFPVATAVFIGVALWILLVSQVVRRGFLAQGQLLESVIDSAVTASPFLSNPQRVEVMALRRPRALVGWECLRVRDRALGERHQPAPRSPAMWIWRRL